MKKKKLHNIPNLNLFHKSCTAGLFIENRKYLLVFELTASPGCRIFSSYATYITVILYYNAVLPKVLSKSCAAVPSATWLDRKWSSSDIFRKCSPKVSEKIFTGLVWRVVLMINFKNPGYYQHKDTKILRLIYVIKKYKYEKKTIYRKKYTWNGKRNGNQR